MSLIMMNTFVLVGKIAELPELKETSSGFKVASMIIEVERSFKNVDGLYEHDYFPLTLWKGLAETTTEIANIDDVVAIKGRVQSNRFESNNRVYYNHEFIAEKLSFIKKAN